MAAGSAPARATAARTAVVVAVSQSAGAVSLLRGPGLCTG
jgi:hypothetical protein